MLAPPRPKHSRPKRRANAQPMPRHEIGPGLHAKELSLQKTLHRSPKHPLCVLHVSSRKPLVGPLQASCVTIRHIFHWPCTLCKSMTVWTLEVSPPPYRDTLNWPGRSPGVKGKSHLQTLLSITLCPLFICLIMYSYTICERSTDLLLCYSAVALASFYEQPRCFLPPLWSTKALHRTTICVHFLTF